MKRILSILLSLSMIFAISTSAFAAENDVIEDSLNEIKIVEKDGVIVALSLSA